MNLFYLLSDIEIITLNYQSGDLISLLDIKEKLNNLSNILQNDDNLKKLNIIINGLLKIIEIIKKDNTKEEQIISLIKNVIILLKDYISKTINAKEFSEKINSIIPDINELLKFIKNENVNNNELLEKTKSKINYPDDYFNNIIEDKNLIKQFYYETIEHLEQAQSKLIDLEFDPKNKEMLNETYRNFHTIKGSSSFLGLKNIEEISHNIESLFDLIKKEKIILNKELINVVFFGIQLIKNILDIMIDLNFDKEGMKQNFIHLDIFSYTNLLKKILSEYQIKRIGEILSEEGKLTIDQINEALDKQSKEHKKMGEILIEEKLITNDDIKKALEKQNQARKKYKELEYVKVSNERLNNLIDIVGELVIIESMLKEEIIKNRAKLNISDRTLSELEIITKNIKNIVLSMGMVPISDLFNKLKVIARNTAVELNKAIIIDIEGAETEIDRNIIEVLYDPLLHIIRNAIDHGIESPEEREKKGKDKIGKIDLIAKHKGSGIEIIVSDDGKGIDKNKIIEKALSMNLIQNDKINSLSEKDIYNFLFLPGFSTSSNITRISGRGIGLDIVKKNIESIHGKVEIISELNKGTSFIIKLPLTLAIIEGFVTLVDKIKYVFPSNLIEEIIVLNKNEINLNKNTNEAIIFHRGTHIPVIFLRDLFNKNKLDNDNLISLLVNFEGSKYCFIVDEIVGKQEIVIKSLSNLLKEYKYFSGGTIFGDGSIGFVMDVQGIVDILSKSS